MMQKLKQAFPLKSILLLSLSENYHSSPSKARISWITAYSTLSQNKAFSPDPNSHNSVLADYLVGSLKFSNDKALSVSTKFSHDRYLEKPVQVVHFLRGLGFTDAHIQSVVHPIPRVLFTDVEKTLKPKFTLFQELGLSGPDLGYFISKNPHILRCSVEGTLKPVFGLIKEVFANDGRNRTTEMVNEDLFRILSRCNRIVLSKQTLEANILYLESCGIVGSQLSSLLYRLPRIFTLKQDKLAGVVSRAVAMNFTMGSRMLVHGIHSLSCMSLDTLNGKFDVLREFGFSEEEIGSMFRKSPYIFGLSVATLRCKLELLLNKLQIDRLVVVQISGMLSMNIEERVIPRYKVLEILKLRGLLKKDPSLSRAMCLPEGRFLRSYVLPFENYAEEIQLAYYGKNLSAVPQE